MPVTYIVGNSGAARECYWILQDLLASAPGLASYYQFGGFFSLGGHSHNLKDLASYALGPVEEHDVSPEALYIIGVGDPGLRRDAFVYLKKRSAILMNLIHPWTYVCPSAKMGEGNVLQRGCTLYADAEIGDGNYINGAVNLSHDAKIGNFNFLAPYSIVLGGARIGDLNHLGPHAVILEHAQLGNNNSLAPGATLFRKCGDNARLAGSPALKIGAFQQEDGNRF